MGDTAKLAASFTLEQLAWWVVGGVVGKGLHVAFEAVAPTVVRVLSAGGRQAVQWFRAVLVRASVLERQQLIALWTKVETQGLGSLTLAERGKLAELMQRLERTLATPLDEKAKRYFWSTARKDFYHKFPDLAEKLVNADGQPYDVHHLIPLEYAHLFPELNINAFENLAAVAKPVHTSIGKVWTMIRSRQGTATNAAHVREVEETVRRRYGAWFNQVYEDIPTASRALEETERAAITEVEQLLARIGR
jgi:hypothetical protein